MWRVGGWAWLRWVGCDARLEYAMDVVRDGTGMVDGRGGEVDRCAVQGGGNGGRWYAWYDGGTGITRIDIA